MKATVVDLRYKMNEILRALDRREKVTLLYHGKVKGTIIPAKNNRNISVISHPFFNMSGEHPQTVSEQLDKLRDDRYHDL